MDFNQVQQDLNKYLEIAGEYFKNLPQDELYSWIAIGSGALLLMVGIILW